MERHVGGVSHARTHVHTHTHARAYTRTPLTLSATVVVEAAWGRLSSSSFIGHLVSLLTLPLSTPQLEARLQALKKNRQAREKRMKDAAAGTVAPVPEQSTGSYAAVSTSSSYVATTSSAAGALMTMAPQPIARNGTRL